MKNRLQLLKEDIVTARLNLTRATKAKARGRIIMRDAMRRNDWATADRMQAAIDDIDVFIKIHHVKIDGLRIGVSRRVRGNA